MCIRDRDSEFHFVENFTLKQIIVRHFTNFEVNYALSIRPSGTDSKLKQEKVHYSRRICHSWDCWSEKIYLSAKSKVGFHLNVRPLAFYFPTLTLIWLVYWYFIGGFNASVIGRGGIGNGIDGGNLDIPPYSSSIYHSPPLSANTTPRRALELENLSIAQLSSLAPVSTF